MVTRPRALPGAWYPITEGEVLAFVARCREESLADAGGSVGKGASTGKGGPFCRGALCPHAGWYYSGDLAFAALASLSSELETLVIMAGHLGENAPLHYALEEAFETPSGPVPADTALLGRLLAALDEEGSEYTGDLRPVSDRASDNGVEILLPFVPILFPRARVLWLRVPPSSVSLALGAVLSRLLSAPLEEGRAGLVASTDLTHYGPNYGFSPPESLRDPARWVHEQNDAAFLEALFAGDPPAVLQSARRDTSACSAGGAAALVRALGPASRLLVHADSLRRGPSSSFVSYAALSWR